LAQPRPELARPLVFFLSHALALVLPHAVAGQSPSVLSLLPTEGRQLTLDGEQSGALSASDHVSLSDNHLEAWALTGQAGGSVTVDLTSDAFDPVLYVVGPGLGETLYDDDGGDGCSARITFTFLESGVFTVVASSVGPGERGTYVLRTSTARPAAPRYACGEPDPTVFLSLPTEGRVLSMGAQERGSLSPFSPSLDGGRQGEAWTLTGQPGERMTVVLESSDFDAFLYVVGPDASSILTDDDGAGGLDSRIDFTVESTLPYTVIASTVSEEGAGGYTIRVEAPPELATLPTEGRSIRPGETAEGTFPSAGPVLLDGRRGQAWALEAEAGQSFTIDLRSEAFDAYLYLAGPGLTEPLSDDDGGGNLDSRIAFTAPESGTYRIIVSGLGGDASGPFTLTVGPM
jgi:hypothetical protein